MRQFTRDRSGRRRRQGVALAVAAMGLGAGAQRAHAATLKFDSDVTPGNGATDGGGVWNISASNWYNGTTDVTWPNTSADTAVFGNGGTGGAVTVDTVTAGAIAFNASGYTLAGGTISLQNTGSAAPVISMAAGVSAAINSTLATVTSSGIAFNGSNNSTLNFGGTNTYLGGTSVNGGTLNFVDGSAFAPTSGGLNVNGVTSSTISTVNVQSANHTFAFFGMSIGSGGTGTGSLNVTAGNVTNAGNTYIARTNGGFGNLLVSGNATFTETSSTTSVGQGATGTMTVVGNGQYLAAAATGGFNVGDGTTGRGLLNIGDSAVVTTYATWIGKTGNAVGVVNQSGGSYTQNTTQSFIVGGNTSADTVASGTYNISGGSLAIGNASGGTFYLGYYGKGVLNLSGSGAVTTSATDIGTFNVATGTVNQTGGTYTQSTASDFRIGGGGSTADNKSIGTYNLSAGTLSTGNASGGNFYVGTFGTGILNLSGTGTVSATQLKVGYIVGGSGLVNQSGGTLNVTPTANALFRLGAGTTGVGIYALSAGTINDNADFQLGYGGTGGFYQNGGTVNVSSGYPSAARAPGGYGVFDIAGGAFNQGNAGANFNVGEQGIGVLNVRGTGVVDAMGSINIGTSTGPTYNGSGTVNLLTGGTITTKSVIKGSSQLAGSAVFDFNGGTLATRSTSPTAFMAGLDAAYVYGGGALIDTSAAGVTIAQPLLAPTGNGVGTIPVTGGAGFRVAPIVQITGGGGANATAIATIDASGNLTGFTITNPGTGYTSVPSVTLYNAAGGSGYTISSPTLIDNTATAGGLTKLGGNTLTLTGASTYGGTTNVSAGTLRVNGSTLSTGAVTVASGATLGGNGSVGSVNVAGTITAGADASSIGNLSTGAQTWASGGTFNAKFSTDNSTNDRLVMSGLTYTGGSFTVNVTGDNVQFAGGPNVLAVDTGAASGSDPFVVGSLLLTVNGASPVILSLAEQDDTTGLGGVDLILTAAAPEPTSLLLAGLAAAPMLASRRRSRRRGVEAKQ